MVSTENNFTRGLNKLVLYIDPRGNQSRQLFESWEGMNKTRVSRRLPTVKLVSAIPQLELNLVKQT